MKSRVLLLTFTIFFILILASCSIIPSPDIDETKIESIINEYFWAINEQNWEEAKNCCIYWSDRYDATCDLEEHITGLWEQYNVVNISCFVTIYDISIDDKCADAYINLDIEVTDGFDDIIYHEQDYYKYYLQEVDECTWKIYGPDIGEFI